MVNSLKINDPYSLKTENREFVNMPETYFVIHV